MFFFIPWSLYLPFGITILSLVSGWMRHSFRECARVWIVCSNRRRVKRSD
jgi:hypothetical protein